MEGALSHGAAWLYVLCRGQRCCGQLHDVWSPPRGYACLCGEWVGQVEFEGEKAIDVKGVRRELVTLVSRAMTAPDRRLFRCGEDLAYFPQCVRRLLTRARVRVS